MYVGCFDVDKMTRYQGGFCVESTRNTGEGDSNDNPRGQYSNPSRRRSIDQSKKGKEKRVSEFGITGRKHKTEGDWNSEIDRLVDIRKHVEPPCLYCLRLKPV
jgi:hypothetical protein